MTTTARSHSPFLSTFPGRYYYDPAIFEEEEQRIFGEMWFFVCRADALPLRERVRAGRDEALVLRLRAQDRAEHRDGAAAVARVGGVLLAGPRQRGSAGAGSPARRTPS